MKIRVTQKSEVEIDLEEQRRITIHTIAELFRLPDPSIYKYFRCDGQAANYEGGRYYYTQIIGEGDRSNEHLDKLNALQMRAIDLILAMHPLELRKYNFNK
jgi:hypothetical protein